MARKRKRSGATEEQPTLALGLAPGAERVLVLGRERDRLVTQVGQKKRLLERCEAEIERAREVLEARLGGLVSERHALDHETHGWFGKLLSPGRLSKRKRKEIRALYLFLQAEEVLSPRPLDDPKDAANFDAGAAASDDDEWPNASAEREPRMAASAPKVAAAGRDALRALFKRLAVALHPDRAQSAEDQERLTQVMKEVTRAYEEQDLARLLEIEQREDDKGALGAASTTSNDERVRAIEHAITELRRQLRELSKAAKNLRQSDIYQLARALEQGPHEDPIQDLERGVRIELERLRNIRDYARDFAEGKLSWERFMEGPPPSPEDEAAFEAMLDVLAEGFAFDPEPPRRGKGRRGGSPPPDDIPF